MPEDTQRPPPVRKELLERFKQDVRERYGKVRGHYGTELERAIESYLEASKGGDVTHRLEQIENDLADIKDTLSDETAKKQKDTSPSTTTEKRLRKIEQTIQEETGGQPKVHDEVVEMAIRKSAGGSQPTLKRYKELLKSENSLFDHPLNDSLYFREPEDFAKAVNALAKGNQITGSEYESIVENYGRDWWAMQLDDNEHNERGIQ